MFCIFFASCKDKYPGGPLVIKNNTDNRIYHWFAHWNGSDWKLYHYPDTILPEKRPPSIFSISPYNSITASNADPDWVTIFSELPAGKLSVYFFLEDPSSQEKWDSIRINHAYYRKDVTHQELIDNNYVISYP
jgi:hypothetical protein